MIKFLATYFKGGQLLGLGITAGNVRRMKAGDPIFIRKGDMIGLPFDVMIFYGENEEDILKQMREKGAVFDEHTMSHRGDRHS